MRFKVLLSSRLTWLGWRLAERLNGGSLRRKVPYRRSGLSGSICSAQNASRSSIAAGRSFQVLVAAGVPDRVAVVRILHP